MPKFLIEDTWNATDIIQYAIDHNIEYKELSQDALYAMDSNEFLQHVYFCSTDIVQKHLHRNIPDCYDSRYSHLFKRTISKSLFKDIKPGNVFIKPQGNNKSFDGTIFNSYDDFYLTGKTIPEPETPCYVVNVIKLLSEYRLLIGNNKVYGVGYMTGVKLPIPSLQPYILASGGDFLCVDIGLTPSGWVVVEINPPFSLDDYDIELSSYIQYCIDATEYYHGMQKLILLDKKGASDIT